MKVLVAGASGAIGIPLIKELVAQGHNVSGLTNSIRGADKIRADGAVPVQTDIFDGTAIRALLGQIEPEVVIDELTSLPANPADMPRASAGDRKLRLEGGGNLFSAAVEVGVRRYIQQSSGFFLTAPMGELANEDSPLALEASPGVRASTTMYAELERRVRSSSIEWVALRYGFFYGPGTWYWRDGAAADQARAQQSAMIDNGQAMWSFVHVVDAASATAAAIDAPSGVYVLADSDPSLVSSWLPAFARWVNAPPPPSISVEQALQTAGGEDAVYYGTRLSGATNAKARSVLGFKPRPCCGSSDEDGILGTNVDMKQSKSWTSYQAAVSLRHVTDDREELNEQPVKSLHNVSNTRTSRNRV